MSPKVFQAILQKIYGAMPRQADLQAQFYLGRNFFIRLLKSRDQFANIVIEKLTESPYVLTDFQNRDAVRFCLRERRFDQQPSTVRAVEVIADVFAAPCVHLAHGSQRLGDWIDLMPGFIKDIFPAAAEHKMVVQIRFRKCSDIIYISAFQRFRKSHLDCSCPKSNVLSSSTGKVIFTKPTEV